ncbi:helix-turn-helix domain-containing protein [Maribacter sp.]|uniref:helix-turn-helix domain-containing protein n=1 Tax=Maribacter sp. TaxID=1897614 RepID=UPI0032999A6F
MEEDKRQFTGIWIPRVIYLNTELNWPAKILVLEIHSFTANGQECFMSNEYISSFLKISIRQVSRLISQLKELGWIEEYAFDGRKRYLRSCLITDFNRVHTAQTKMSNLPRQKCLGSHDNNGVHIKPINKPDYFIKETKEKLKKKNSRKPLK